MKSFKEILTERTYWGNNASGFIIYAADTKKILCVLRSSRVSEPHTWSITISGKIDGNESPIEAARREMKEELKYSGITSVPKVFDVYEDTDDDGNKFTFTTYFIAVPHEFTPLLNWEHKKAFWWNGKDIIDGKLHFGTKRIIKKMKLEKFSINDLIDNPLIKKLRIVKK